MTSRCKWRLTRKSLREHGIELTESDYYSALGMDDKRFVRAAFERARKNADGRCAEEVTGRQRRFVIAS